MLADTIEAANVGGPGFDDEAPFEITVGPFVGRDLEVVSFRGREQMSGLFSFDVAVAAHVAAPAAFEAAVLGQPARFTMNVHGRSPRLVQGIVAWVQPEGQYSDGAHAYRLGVVPRMWLLTRRKTSRIFQDRTAPEIVQAVLDEHGVAWRSKLAGTYPTRNYCVQYQETDYAFVTRLLAEEGIAFFFEPPSALLDGLTGGAASALGGLAEDAGLGGLAGALGAVETVVLIDHADAYPPIALGGAAASVAVGVSLDAGGLRAGVSASVGAPPSLLYRDQVGMVTSDDHVHAFRMRRGIKPRAVLLRDYDYRRPQYRVVGRADAGSGIPSAGGTVGVSLGGLASASVSVTAQGSIPPPAVARQQIYEHHGEYDAPDFDHARAARTLEQIRRNAVVARGASRCRHLTPGRTFVLEEHVSDALNRAYVVLRVEHSGRDLRRLRGGEGRRRTTYSNSFACGFAETLYRPRRPARTLSQVLETATVVGPAGEEIYTDELGRIKVQFHWDLEGKHDEHSSCWIRVSQPWAGSGWGFQFIPRIGMEVLVSFVGGDEDRPMITGCVYNGTHPTSYPLPVRKTRSGIRSQSTPGGGGWNEIAFEDQSGREELYLHAQKDLVEDVRHDRRATVGQDLVEHVARDRRTEVAGMRADRVHGSDRAMVGGARSVEVGGSDELHVAGARGVKVGRDAREEVGGSHDLRIAGAQTVDVVGAVREQIRGDRRSYVFGEETRVVWQDSHTVVNQSCALNVHKDFAVAVGTETAKGTARSIVHGDAKTYVSGKSEITIDQGLTIKIGKNKITIDENGVKIEASSIELAADSIKGASKKGAISLDDKVELSGKSVKIFSADNAILELAQTAKLDAQALKLNCQNSAQQAEAKKKSDEAKNLEKLSVKLFDLSGALLDAAPYEVSCQGYLDKGTASGGVVKVPKFPDVEKCQVRWARPMDERKKELGGEDVSLPEYEYQMEIYLSFDAPDEKENLRRKLHNMGQQGTLEQAVRSFHAAKGITSGPMKLDDIKGEVASRHDAQEPITYAKGSSS